MTFRMRTPRLIFRASLIAVLFFLAPSAAAQDSFVRREDVPSRLLGRSVPVVVLLPPSYGKEKGRLYPVIYFLHDGGGNERSLIRRGIAERILAAMRGGTFPELLIVAPRGVGSWFVDSHDGRRPYLKFLTNELVPAIDSRYATSSTREGRAVAGISMGGYGALRWALESPELFRVVGGLSPAIQQLDWEDVASLPFFLRFSLKHAFGASVKDNSLRKNDLYDILLSRPDLGPTLPEVLIRCGREDKYRLGEISIFLKKFFDAMDVKNEVAVESGIHDWPYWRESLPRLLADVATRLKVLR